ncbi:permease [Otariodibacter sp.]|uniref:permease n=1 Tax=Otariodibacter sp. TaxID=3030919 RepID=UPI00260D229E|nr:permease [Otariodibacter sp.]
MTSTKRKYSINKYIQFISKKYQSIEQYFTNGSFGVKFYPLLMSPFVRVTNKLLVRMLAFLAVFIGIDYFAAELITIVFSNVGFLAYYDHTILELLLPIGSIVDSQTSQLSPLSFVMKATFMVHGSLFLFIYLIAVNQMIKGFRLIGSMAAIFFSLGMILIYSAQGGHYTEGGLQNLGVSITFLLGNIMMIVTGIGIDKPFLRKFKLFSLIAGGIGIIAIGITMFGFTNYLAIFERISFYLVVIWDVALGFAILRYVR